MHVLSDHSCVVLLLRGPLVEVNSRARRARIHHDAVLRDKKVAPQLQSNTSLQISSPHPVWINQIHAVYVSPIISSLLATGVILISLTSTHNGTVQNYQDSQTVTAMETPALFSCCVTSACVGIISQHSEKHFLPTAT